MCEIFAASRFIQQLNDIGLGTLLQGSKSAVDEESSGQRLNAVMNVFSNEPGSPGTIWRTLVIRRGLLLLSRPILQLLANGTGDKYEPVRYNNDDSLHHGVIHVNSTYYLYKAEAVF